MLSFEVKGGKAAGMKFVNSLKLFAIAVSFSFDAYNEVEI